MGEKKTGGDRVSVKERLMDGRVREAEGYRQGMESCFRSSAPEYIFPSCRHIKEKRQREARNIDIYSMQYIHIYIYCRHGREVREGPKG